jgi:hypothetical protein
VFGAKAQRASLLGDFCNEICHKPTCAVQQYNAIR